MVPYPLTVFYDGACPLCAREMALMKRLDRNHRLNLCGFSALGYEAESTGLDPARLGAVLHAQWEDGTIMTGVEAFRAIWQAVGLGILVRLSRLPVIDPLLIRAYAWFAQNRLWLTGRNGCSSERCHTAPTPQQ
ncbi:MAG: DUF393 domain-containing protein [Nitrospira sp. CR1.2]|nr:DUF393 domain-containing protein [Nitrospira sp. CR1.2]